MLSIERAQTRKQELVEREERVRRRFTNEANLKFELERIGKEWSDFQEVCPHPQGNFEPSQESGSMEEGCWVGRCGLCKKAPIFLEAGLERIARDHSLTPEQAAVLRNVFGFPNAPGIILPTGAEGERIKNDLLSKLATHVPVFL